MKNITAFILLFLAFQYSYADVYITIRNLSDENVCHVYSTSKKNKKWGKDLLGGDVLKRGYKVTVNPTDGTGDCRFEFMAKGCNGGSWTNREGTYLCGKEKGEASWTLRP